MIGSSRCLLLLWLVGVIALVLVFRQSFENRSIDNVDNVDVSSVSPASERIVGLWVVCVYVGGGGAMQLVEKL